MSDPFSLAGSGVPSAVAQAENGRAVRGTVPRRSLALLETSGRDPLGILDAQNATRVPELVPLRVQRMSASPFAFYRGTAALQAADLARGPSSGILVASCGDAHVSNFGYFASPQRTLVFDLNDFDEAAWAPWEWDLKRLVTSIVIGGRASGRLESVVDRAALDAVRTYARAVRSYARTSPVDRYFEHFEARDALGAMDAASRKAVTGAIRDAERRTRDRAARRLTTTDTEGRARFVDEPPTMMHGTPEQEARLRENVRQYRLSAAVDVRMVLAQYDVVDIVRRVVGVGSVGTLCALVALQDGEGRVLVVQGKEAGRSVLEQYGGVEQPPAFAEHVEAHGQGGRIVAMQRILQALSDPFLGQIRAFAGDFYVRQFNDMKGGIDVEELDDAAFARYGQACAAVLARAHAQSPTIGEVAGYLGGGAVAGAAILAWARAYADLSLEDYHRFVAAHAAARP